jgi:hypothetical protein
LLIQSGSQGRGPETVVAKPTTKVGERLEVSSRDGADLEPDGQGAHPVGDRLIKVPGRLAQVTQFGVASGGGRLVAELLVDFPRERR